MGRVMRARQLHPPDEWPDDYEPGDWWWMDDRSAGICACLPDGQLIEIPTTPNSNGAKWSIAGDGDTITVTPSIHVNPGKWAAGGEWHGFLTNGEWVG